MTTPATTPTPTDPPGPSGQRGAKSRPKPHSHSPVVIAHEAERAKDLQLRVADAITSFAGSMKFVYLHAVVFAVWMIFFEKSPWQTLTLIVSLEAIFLSTFVMIGQNRQADFQQAKADHDFTEDCRSVTEEGVSHVMRVFLRHFTEQETELHYNTDLTKAIHAIAREIHESTCGGAAKA